MIPPIAADLKVLPLSIFGVVLAVTLAITYWASRRTSDATSFWAAGRGVSGVQNGFAIAGDYMSASSFLGFAGLIFLFGFDAMVGLMAAIVAFLPVLLYIAERMRNAGKFTAVDVIAYRLQERPTRVVAAFGTLAVVSVYLIAQMVGAGVLIEALTGLSFTPSVILVGAFMMIYVIFGGMIATTWVQIIKAGLLMMAGIVLAVWVLAEFGFNLSDLFDTAASEHGEGASYFEGGLQFDSKLGLISFGLAFLLGTAGLPHILMRFFTVPNARAARGSVAWAILLIGAFYIIVMLVGTGARAILGQAGESAVGETGNLALPLLAEELGGGSGSAGGDIFLAVISAVALATILAVVAGLVIAASGAVAHDLWSNVVRTGRDSEREEVYVAKIAAAVLGVLAIGVSITGGSGFNVSVLVALAFTIASSATLPALLFALFWRRFNTTGAVVGMSVGLLASLVLILFSVPVWPGPDSEGSPLGSLALDVPAIFSVPIGFLACWLATLASSEPEAERRFDELYVRSETGYGAEAAGGPGAAAPTEAPREPVAVP
jgi:cation/acetate symporter